MKELIDASSLKPEIVEGVDIMVVRELTGDVYFGTPKVRIQCVDRHFGVFMCFGHATPTTEEMCCSSSPAAGRFLGAIESEIFKICCRVVVCRYFAATGTAV